MKKMFLLVLMFLFSVISVNAELLQDNIISIVKSDYINDYTLIDCVNGDDDNGVAFDSNMGYATLKVGIEKTIDYINQNINKAGNEETAIGIIFNIKVKCSFEDLLNNTIDLGFKGVDFHNKLIIEGIDNDSFVLKNTKFRLLKGAGNIIIKNASFLNDEMGYFEDQVFNTSNTLTYPLSKGINIENSYFKLNNKFTLGINSKFSRKYYRYGNGRRYYDYFYTFMNKIKIINSKIDIKLDGDYNFKLPYFIKNSEINFVNNSSTGIYDISFLEESNINNLPKIDYSILVSNKIDIGGNNLIIEKTENITFLNNKINNFKDIDLGDKAVFINNYIKNLENIDITKYVNLFNNIFKSDYIDNNDIHNYRRNFTLENIGSGGLGWIYRRVRDFAFGNIEINSADLFKEVTGKDSVNGLGDIYVIFSY